MTEGWWWCEQVVIVFIELNAKCSKIIVFIELNAIDVEHAVYIHDLCNYLSSAGIEAINEKNLLIKVEKNRNMIIVVTKKRICCYNYSSFPSLSLSFSSLSIWSVNASIFSRAQASFISGLIFKFLSMLNFENWIDAFDCESETCPHCINDFAILSLKLAVVKLPSGVTDRIKVESFLPM